MLWSPGLSLLPVIPKVSQHFTHQDLVYEDDNPYQLHKAQVHEASPFCIYSSNVNHNILIVLRLSNCLRNTSTLCLLKFPH